MADSAIQRPTLVIDRALETPQRLDQLYKPTMEEVREVSSFTEYSNYKHGPTSDSITPRSVRTELTAGRFDASS